MFGKILLGLIFILTLSYGVTTKEGALYKEQQELMIIKDELNEFYEIKELEYQKNKAELLSLQKSIKKDEQTTINLNVKLGRSDSPLMKQYK